MMMVEVKKGVEVRCRSFQRRGAVMDNYGSVGVNCLQHYQLHHPLKTRLLQLPLSQPRLHSNTVSAAYPKLTCTGCTEVQKNRVR